MGYTLCRLRLAWDERHTYNRATWSHGYNYPCHGSLGRVTVCWLGVGSLCVGLEWVTVSRLLRVGRCHRMQSPRCGGFTRLEDLRIVEHFDCTAPCSKDETRPIGVVCSAARAASAPLIRRAAFYGSMDKLPQPPNTPQHPLTPPPPHPLAPTLPLPPASTAPHPPPRPFTQLRSVPVVRKKSFPVWSHAISLTSNGNFTFLSTFILQSK